MDKVGKGGNPFFVWFNSTAIHIWSHPTSKYVRMALDEGRAETDVVRVKMIEHDEHVGAILTRTPRRQQQLSCGRHFGSGRPVCGRETHCSA